MSPVVQGFLAIVCIGGVVMLGCALYGAVREVIDRIGARLARRAARRITVSVKVHAAHWQQIAPWINGQDMPSMPLDHYELTESQRLIDGAFSKESNS